MNRYAADSTHNAAARPPRSDASPGLAGAGPHAARSDSTQGGGVGDVRIAFMAHSRTLALIAAAGLMVGCSTPDHIDATSEETLKSTLGSLVKRAGSAEALAAQARFEAVYFGSADQPDGAPNWAIVDDMSLTDFVRFVAKALPERQDAEQESGNDVVEERAPAPHVREGLLSSLEIARDNLLDDRARAHRNERFTADQFAWSRPEVTLPGAHAIAGLDGLQIRLPFLNSTGFDVYSPSFRVTVAQPGEALPLFDTILRDPDVTVVHAGEPVTLHLSCCSSTESIQKNRELRALPPGATFTYELVSVKSRLKSEMLDSSIYTQASHEQLTHIKACIEDIQRQGDQWTQESSDESCRKTTGSVRLPSHVRSRRG